MDPGQQATIERLAGLLTRDGLRVACAESCTGGRIAAALTAVAGSSAWFDCGCVVYSYPAKCSLLGLDRARLDREGAVSAWAVEAMCAGLLTRCGADVVVASSGIAGPDGGSVEKPVGTVYLCWQRRGEPPYFGHEVYAGDREAITAQVVRGALEGLVRLLE